jgi:hypothetical protein
VPTYLQFRTSQSPSDARGWKRIRRLSAATTRGDAVEPVSLKTCSSISGNVEVRQALQCLIMTSLLTVALCPSTRGLVATENPHARTETVQIESIPPRPSDALSGSAFASRVAALAGTERQEAALSELRRGNVPDFLRTLRPVHLSETHGHRTAHAATIWVMPDYLAIGSNEDFLRIPLSYPSAAAIAEEFDCVLPTPKMVDVIYEQSAHHLAPQPLPAGPEMRSTAYYVEHQRRIEAQRAGIPLGDLIAGHKKDVVITNLLFARPDRVAIYGWHRLSGEPIQPLSTVHGAHYEDYSHGVRLVSSIARVDGTLEPIAEVLKDPARANLLTKEGAVTSLHALMSLGR